METPFPYHPLNEGVDHINVYSKSDLWLGRQLSNFSECNLSTRWGAFKSVEGFWYWLSTGRTCSRLRELHGYQAKELGRGLVTVNVEGFENYIKEAITWKLLMQPGLRQSLRESTLPLTHYYYFGYKENCKVIPLETDWMINHMVAIRSILQLDRPVRTVVAGSRDLNKKENIRRLLMFLDLPLEIVSGLARGPDTHGREIAIEQGWPYKDFPAQWERYDKAAGNIRNGEMADYMDVAIVIWDGKSRGTRNMIEQAHARNKPVLVVMTKG